MLRSHLAGHIWSLAPFVALRPDETEDEDDLWQRAHRERA